MTYNQFIEKVKDEISDRVDIDSTVSLVHVVKNNGTEYDGINILAERGRVVPNIYLNNYYEQYQTGTSLEHIIEDILCLHEEKRDCNDFYIEYEFELLKHKIIYRLVNYEKNQSLLETIPHIPFLDLALIFHILVRNNEEGIGTVRITNEHMDYWGINIEELMKYGKKNTSRIFPVNIHNMKDMIEELFELDPAMVEDNIVNFHLLPKQESEIPMYILTNSNGINGAVAMTYTDALKQFSEFNHSDLYILPSSIHEVILIPYSESLNKAALKEMVMDVNEHQVPEEEILSNEVYLYRRESNRIEI